ncbi:MAG: FAD-binding protein [Pseudomonadota bacterium]
MTPRNEGELAGILKDAAAQGTRLRIKGGGTRTGLGNQVTSNTVVEASALEGISLYEPGALTIVAKAGTPLSEIENTLSEAGQMLPFEPTDHSGLFGHTDGVPTIGGVVAVNASGPRRLQAGACRDALIGVRFVDGTGEIIKNGGRVMKNVTGYDLVKLMAGSYGTLGVLTEVSFKVLPKPETAVTLQIEGLDSKKAQSAMSAAMKTPFDVTGAAHVQSNGNSTTSVRLEGFHASVTYRARELKSVMDRFGRTEVTDQADIWQRLRRFSYMPDSGEIWQISAKPTDSPTILDRVSAYVADYTMDWSGGLLTFSVPQGRDVRADIGGYPAQVVCLRGNARAFHEQPLPLAQIEAGLRGKFDPSNILNPGIMG